MIFNGKVAVITGSTRGIGMHYLIMTGRKSQVNMLTDGTKDSIHW